MVGPNSKLWMASPDLALVILACMPSGDLGIIRSTEVISGLALGPGWLQPASSSSPPALASTSSSLPLGTDTIYIGTADSTTSLRPTQWTNPYCVLLPPHACSTSHGGATVGLGVPLEASPIPHQVGLPEPRARQHSHSMAQPRLAMLLPVKRPTRPPCFTCQRLICATNPLCSPAILSGCNAAQIFRICLHHLAGSGLCATAAVIRLAMDTF